MKPVKSGMWLSQRQVRWLIVLLALLPLIPATGLVQVMWQNAARDRDSTMAEITQVYRDQVALLAERYSLSQDAIGEGGDGDPFSPYLRRVFGEDVILVVIDSTGTTRWGDSGELGRHAIVYEVAKGAFAGWSVSLDRLAEVPGHVARQRRETWWHAVTIIGGVAVCAGGVWFAVHRQLRIDELRGDLLATISHEIKTPVSAIRVLIESLEDPALDEETRADYFRLLQQENGRIADLADQFLTYNRLERGQVRLEWEECRVDRLVKQEVRLARPRFDSVGGEIVVVASSAVSATTDTRAIRMVLANLFDNARKYGGEPPRAEVAVMERGDRVEIEVRDEGPGIARSERRSVFRKFYRSDARLDCGRAGVGLGLAICRSWMKILGGSIEVGEAPAAGGTCMRVTLPRLAVAGTKKERERRAAAA